MRALVVVADVEAIKLRLRVSFADNNQDDNGIAMLQTLRASITKVEQSGRRWTQDRANRTHLLRLKAGFGCSPSRASWRYRRPRHQKATPFKPTFFQKAKAASEMSLVVYSMPVTDSASHNDMPPSTRDCRDHVCCKCGFHLHEIQQSNRWRLCVAVLGNLPAAGAVALTGCLLKRYFAY